MKDSERLLPPNDGESDERGSEEAGEGRKRREEVRMLFFLFIVS